ncbi:unnamed protein product [Durusdinium trenchii]|uniref:Uncharacterized protein n=1 Tax=Durusdinium trenchii TaxID=1381693 RepID=A0ABP0KE03_9DINO
MQPRTTICSKSEPSASPWREVFGFSRDRQCWDCMHLVHLGFLRDITASCLADMFQTGDLADYVNLAPGASAALVFWRVGALAEQWAKQNQLDLGAVRLTEERLNYTQTTYPCLDSLVKAARGRVLFEYVCKICLDVERNLPADRPASDIYHSQLRASMCWCLSACLSIWSKGKKPKLSQQEKEKSVWLGRSHLVCYAALAAGALAQHQLLYKVRPKCHYFEHALDECALWGNNPLSQSSFLDEDNMKSLRNLAVKCHPRTVKVTWARRYILKKVLLWHKLKAE